MSPSPPSEPRRRALSPPQPPAAALAAGVAWLQGLLVLSWTLYALYLPSLADRAGLARSWVPWLLLVDQLLFAAGDWAAGLYADRLRRALRAVGPRVLASALASALLLAALPAVASLASPGALAAAALLWAVSSSMLRAPVFALLGRLAPGTPRAGAVHLALAGIALASAVGPLLTRALHGVDPSAPLWLASLALVVAAWPVLRLEPRRAVPPAAPPVADWRALGLLSLAMLALAFAVQVFSVLLPPRLTDGGAGWNALWAPLFWCGFALGLGFGPALAARVAAARRDTIALTVGAVALWLAPLADAAWRALALVAAGLCWALVFAAALASVLRFGRDAGLSAPVGVFVSALALAAAARLWLVVTGAAAWLPLDDLALAAWIAGATGVLAARARLAD